MTVISTTRDSITIVKSFSYRGAAELYSNTYFMDGATPASAASWKTLADAVMAAEKLMHSSDVTMVAAVGHKAGDSVAVWSRDYAAAGDSVVGTYTPTGGIRGGGDTATWVRWATGALTSKGKPIFLRNYFHPAWASAAAPDTCLASLKTAMETYGTAWITGFTDGGSVVHHRAGPHGAAGVAPVVGSTYVTTRTLERRGKRSH